MLGASVFIAAALVPRALPHPTLVLLAWVSGGLLTLAGALSYAELGAMFPKAGGQYHFLKEAFGPLSGFLFGWTSFLVAQSAAIAYIAVAFGEYPPHSSHRSLRRTFSWPCPSADWRGRSTPYRSWALSPLSHSRL
jgi:amino acid transporter